MENILSSFGFFTGLPDEVLAGFYKLTSQREIAAGEILFSQGDKGAEAFLILKGGLRVERINEKGDRVLLNIIGPGEFLGETALLTGNPRMAGAVAQADSTLLALQAAQFEEMLALHPQMNARMMRLISVRLSGVGAKLEEVGLNSLAFRLGGILLDFMARFPGRPAQKGLIDIRLTQNDLAELALSSREHVNRQIKAWEKAGILHVEQGKITVLKPDGLRRE